MLKCHIMALRVETCVQAGNSEFGKMVDILPGRKLEHSFRTGNNSVTKLTMACNGENISTISEAHMEGGKLDPSKKTETHTLAPGDEPHEIQINMKQGRGNKRPPTTVFYIFTATK